MGARLSARRVQDGDISIGDDHPGLLAGDQPGISNATPREDYLSHARDGMPPQTGGAQPEAVSPARAPERLVAMLLVGLIALLFLGWQSTHLSGPGTGYDEGVYLSSAQSLASGHAPYKTLFFSKPPLFALFLDVVGRVSGWHLSGYRLAMVLCGLVTLLASAALAWRWRGPRVAVATAALLAVNPKFVFYARPLGSDAPVFALMMLGLLAGAIAIERQSRWAWIAAGGAAMAAIGMKPNGGLIIPIIAVGVAWWLVHAPHPAWLPAVARCAFALVGAVLVALIMLPFARQPHAYAQSITYELSGRAVYPLDPIGNLRHIVSFIFVDRGLIILAVIGLARAPRRPVALVPVLLLAWLAFNGGFLILHTPLFSHHIPALLPPLAIFAGAGLVAVIERIFASVSALRARRALDAAAWVMSVASLLILLGVIALVPHLGSINHASARQLRSARARELDAALRQYVPRGGMVVTDDQFATFRARLPIVPWFADTSTYRIDSGYLTSAEAIARTEAGHPAAVVIASDKLPRLHEYVAWVEQRYDRVWSNGSRAIYRARESQ